MNSSTSTRSPWAWIPSLYFAEGIPYVVVMTVSVVMYKRLNISNTDIALYTSSLYLPWVIKPLWSPLVDLLATKRWWIVAMQGVIAVLLAGLAFAIPLPSFLQYTLALFWLMAFSSATHDIAADGFYMLGIDQHAQAAFVGVRSTFYRIATIAAQGLLVILAGTIEGSSGLPVVNFQVRSNPAAAAYTTTLPTSAEQSTSTDQLLLVTGQNNLEIAALPRDKPEVDALIAIAKKSNIELGFRLPDVAAGGKTQPSLWKQYVADPSAAYLRSHFGGQQTKVSVASGNVGIATLRLSRPPDHEVVVVVSRTSGDESMTVAEGARLSFNANNWDKPAMVVFQLDPKLRTAAEAQFGATSGNIPLAWSTVFATLAATFVIFCIYHKVMLPRPPQDHAASAGQGSGMVREFFRTFALFFKKRRIVVTLFFLLFYRFAEAQLVKLVSPFLLDAREVGGLGLTTGQVGWIYGTFGIMALMAGGLAGGYLISRHGLRSWLWPMVIIMHAPDLMFVYLAYALPHDLRLIGLAVAVEQFGYGFGFTAYMLYMIMIAQGEHKTAHYAICTGFMALGMMLPGMFSGWLQEIVGYRHFFLWVMISTLPGFLVAALVSIEPGFGRKQQAAVNG